MRKQEISFVMTFMDKWFSWKSYCVKNLIRQMINSGCSLEKEFTKFICINP